MCARLPLPALLTRVLPPWRPQPHWVIILGHPLTLVADQLASLGMVLTHLVPLAVAVDGGDRGLDLGGVPAQEALPPVLVAIDVRGT